MLIDPLVIVRDIHLASTLIVAGIIFFDLFIVAPIWKTLSPSGVAQKCFQSSSDKILWASLALSIASALAADTMSWLTVVRPVIRCIAEE